MNALDLIDFGDSHAEEEEQEIPANVVVGEQNTAAQNGESPFGLQARRAQNDDEEIERASEFNRDSPQVEVVA